MCSIEAPPLCAGLSHNAVALEGTARCVKRTDSQSSARLLEVIEVSRGLSQRWLRMEELAMETQGIVVLPGQGSVWNMPPGRSAALKLPGGATVGSLMLFEDTGPAGTMSTIHLHHDSDEAACLTRG